MRTTQLEDTPLLTRRRVAITVAVVIAALLTTLACEALVGQLLDLEPQSLRDWLNDRGPVAPILFIALMAAAIVISPIPSVPLDIAAGLAFGLLWGTVYVLIGAEIGALIAFLIARRVGRPGLERWASTRTIEAIDRLADRMGWRGVAVMRLIPLFHFDWVSYGAGLSRMPILSFATATLVGMLIPVVAIVAVGDSLADSPLRAASIFGALVLLTVAPVVWWFWQRRRTSAPA